ncbi:hypothetical protein C8039_02105 [Halogeometricum sp. wsp3]|nr:hypothetical protein C8039_02105 [Halogeometricum sp. wsp3]
MAPLAPPVDETTEVRNRLTKSDTEHADRRFLKPGTEDICPDATTTEANRSSNPSLTSSAAR